MLEFVLIAFLTLTVLLLLLAYWPKPAPVERRAALVIGNGAYKWSNPLKAPPNDAADMAEALTGLGYDVVAGTNLGVAQMRGMLKAFEQKAKSSAWALVFYSGHGLQWDGVNWLIPIDFRARHVADLPLQAVSVDEVLKYMSGASKLRIVLLNGCRNNPFRFIEGHPQGLARMTPAYGEIVFFAARHGTFSYEVTANRNSIFAEALLKHMGEERLELGRFFRKVTSSVMETVEAFNTKYPKENIKQEPFVYGHIPDEDFYLRPPRR